MKRATVADLPADFGEIDTMITASARRYRRRCWWADMRELCQVGWIAVLECAPNWDPDMESSFCAYARTAVVRKMNESVRRAITPVSPGRGRSALKRVEGMYNTADPGMAIAEIRGAFPAPDDAVDETVWSDRVNAALERAAQLLPRRDREMAKCVLISEIPPRVVADAFGVSPYEVYSATETMRASIIGDRELYDLVEERTRA